MRLVVTNDFLYFFFQIEVVRNVPLVPRRRLGGQQQQQPGAGFEGQIDGDPLNQLSRPRPPG